jgi:hypothetical protein
MPPSIRILEGSIDEAATIGGTVVGRDRLD